MTPIDLREIDQRERLRLYHEAIRRRESSEFPDKFFVCACLWGVLLVKILVMMGGLE